MELTGGWEVAPTPPGRFAAPGELQGVEWRAARVPGTAAAAVGADGRDFDAEDWWFRCRFAPPPDIAGQVALELDGIATLAEVFVNGELVLESTSMWQRHEVDLTGRLSVDNELAICCRALAPVLSRRRRPSSRWRTRTVNAGNLRWHRTMIFGRSPGFAPQPAAVGPWRPIRLVAGHERRLALLGIRSHLEGDDGRVLVTGRVLDQGAVSPSVSLLGQRVRLQPGEDGLVRAEVHVPRVARWWPHTHGSPTLHELVLELDGEPVMTRRVGFRDLSWSPEIAEAGLELRVNGVPLFARGAVWTPPDLIGMAPGAEELRRLLERVRDAGMNMLRIPGTAAYESPRFHDLCDELGILVWQDLMFANLD
jgi:beta-mannosidase